LEEELKCKDQSLWEQKVAVACLSKRRQINFLELFPKLCSQRLAFYQTLSLNNPYDVLELLREVGLELLLGLYNLAVGI